MKDINVLGTVLLDSTGEDFPALLKFNRTEGGTLSIIGDGGRAANLRKNTLRSMFEDDEGSKKESSFVFNASYDFAENRPIARRFFLDSCMSLGGGMHSGQTGNAATAIFRVGWIHETDIIWDEGEEPHYNYVRFSFQNIEEWIHSLSDIMIDLDGDNGNDQKIGVSRKSSELVTIDGLGDLQIKAIANCHDFVLKLQKPLLTEKIVSLVGNIRNIIQLGINSLILIDSIAVKLSSVSDYDTFLYFSPAEPRDVEIKTKHLQNRFNFLFTYEDIGCIEGIKNWLLRMNLSELHRWDETLMVAFLLEGHHRSTFATEYNIMPVITAALMLVGEREKTIPERLYRLLKSAMYHCDPYFDGKWCEAVAAVRNRCIAHPESLKGAKFPGGAALFARELLYRICVSFIVKEMMGLPANQSESIVQKIWQHDHTKQYLRLAKYEDIKVWFDELSKDSRSVKEIEMNRKNIFTQAKLPPDFNKLPKNILGSPETANDFSLYSYYCPDCGCEWHALKPKRGGYEVAIKGHLNSDDSDTWDTLDICTNKKDANKAVRESVSKHFCVPFNNLPIIKNLQ